MIGVHLGQLVYLRDVAEILMGPKNRWTMCCSAMEAARGRAVHRNSEEPAVTLAIAKRKGQCRGGGGSGDA